METDMKDNPFFSGIYKENYNLNNNEISSVEVIKYGNDNFLNLQKDRREFVDILFMNKSSKEIIYEIEYVMDKDLFINYIIEGNIKWRYKDQFTKVCMDLILDNYECDDKSRKDSLLYFSEILLNTYTFHYFDALEECKNDEQILSVLLKLDYSKIIEFDNLLDLFPKAENDYWMKFRRYKSVKLVDQDYVLNKLFQNKKYEMVVDLVIYHFITTGIINKKSFDLLLVSLSKNEPGSIKYYERLEDIQGKLYEYYKCQYKIPQLCAVKIPHFHSNLVYL